MSSTMPPPDPTHVVIVDTAPTRSNGDGCTYAVLEVRNLESGDSLANTPAVPNPTQPINPWASRLSNKPKRRRWWRRRR